MDENSNQLNQLLSPYFKEIYTLNEEVQKHESLLEVYSQKYKEMNKEYEDKKKELDKEEIEISKQFISTVESEDFFKDPSEDIKEIVDEAKGHKDILNKKKGRALLHKQKIEKTQKELDDKVNSMNEEQKELYEVICNLILGKKNETKENAMDIIKNNQGMIRLISSKCSKIKKGVEDEDKIENVSKITVPNLNIVNLTSARKSNRGSMSSLRGKKSTSVEKKKSSVNKDDKEERKQKEKEALMEKEKAIEMNKEKIKQERLKEKERKEIREKERQKERDRILKMREKDEQRIKEIEMQKEAERKLKSNKPQSLEKQHNNTLVATKSKKIKPTKSSSSLSNNSSNNHPTNIKPRYTQYQNTHTKEEKKIPNISVHTHFSNHSCSSISRPLNISVSPNRSIATVSSVYDVGNTNKSFYLLRNARIEKAMRHNTEISQDDIGGENCCYRLLRNYQNDIRNTSVEFLRNTKARSRSSCHNKSYIGDRSYIRERFEQKMENTPKIYIKGRYVKQNLIGQATDTENGIIEQNMIYN